MKIKQDKLTHDSEFHISHLHVTLSFSTIQQFN